MEQHAHARSRLSRPAQTQSALHKPGERLPMKSARRRLEQILDFARRGSRPVPPPVEPPSAEMILSLTRRSFAKSRTAAAFDPWRIWERAGGWSLAGATAILLLV